MEDIRLIVALVGGMVALVLWVLARVYELFVESRQRESVRRNFIRALYAEIDFNARDMEIFQSRPLTPQLESNIRENASI